MTDTAPATIVVDVDASQPIGTFTPLHGVNNGPICFGGIADLTPWHRELNLPSTRLHDSGWPGPVVVDLPMIFPDFSADPEDPASYRFAKTDDYLESILPVSQKIVYRLGTSIEWTKRTYDTMPPADYAHWAKICIGVIRHFNEGWANGHHYGIRHFEIWNEPDIGDKMWTGTLQDYLELYAVASKAIKAHDPHLLVGGPVVANIDGDLAPMFVDYVIKNDLPLDFFDWHHYAKDPQDLARRAAWVRNLLDTHGLQHVESYLTEWNWVDSWDWEGDKARELHRRNRSARGGAFVASSMMLLQDAGLDDAHYFSGDTQWFGLFDEFGIPQKNYFGMLASSKLMGCQERLAVEVDAGEGLDVTAAAGRSGQDVVALVSSFDGVPARLRLSLHGLPDDVAIEYRLHWVDDAHDLEHTQTITASGSTLELETAMPAGTVLMVTGTPRG